MIWSGVSFTPELNSASAANTETNVVIVMESTFTTTEEISDSSEEFEEPMDVKSKTDGEEEKSNCNFRRHSNGFGASIPEMIPYAAGCLKEQSCFCPQSELMLSKVHDLAFPRPFLLLLH